MNYLSHVTLLVFLLYIATVCVGHRHIRRARRPQTDWYKYKHRSYSRHESKLQELRLLTDIYVRLNGIILALQQKKQGQPAYVPIYVPYFLSNNSGYTVPYKGDNFHGRTPDSTPFPTTTAKPVEPEASENTKTQTEINKLVDLYLGNNNEVDSSKNTKDKGIEYPQGVGSSDNLKCKIATIGCCRFVKAKEKQNCFEFYKCPELYGDKESCTTEAIDTAVVGIVETYGPSKDIF